MNFAFSIPFFFGTTHFTAHLVPKYQISSRYILRLWLLWWVYQANCMQPRFSLYWQFQQNLNPDNMSRQYLHLVDTYICNRWYKLSCVHKNCFGLFFIVSLLIAYLLNGPQLRSLWNQASVRGNIMDRCMKESNAASLWVIGLSRKFMLVLFSIYKNKVCLGIHNISAVVVFIFVQGFGTSFG